MNPQCPKCGSESLAVERRPNGNAKCLSNYCSWEGPYNDCFPREVQRKPDDIHLELARLKADYENLKTTAQNNAWAAENASRELNCANRRIVEFEDIKKAHLEVQGLLHTKILKAESYIRAAGWWDDYERKCL